MDQFNKLPDDVKETLNGGYLRKEKSDSKNGGEKRNEFVLRYFNIKLAVGYEDDGPALHYYATEEAWSPKAWYLLSEITSVEEESLNEEQDGDEDANNSFLVVRHPNRTLRLKALTVREHKHWKHGLTVLCNLSGKEFEVASLNPIITRQSSHSEMDSTVNVASLKDYLLKQKSNKKNSTAERDFVQRWFVVEAVDDTDQNGLALHCYPRRGASKATAWYFLNEIEEIDELTFRKQLVLRHPQKTLVLQATTNEIHRKWLAGLSTLCVNAKMFKDGSARASFVTLNLPLTRASMLRKVEERKYQLQGELDFIRRLNKTDASGERETNESEDLLHCPDVLVEQNYSANDKPEPLTKLDETAEEPIISIPPKDRKIDPQNDNDVSQHAGEKNTYADASDVDEGNESEFSSAEAPIREVPVYKEIFQELPPDDSDEEQIEIKHKYNQVVKPIVTLETSKHDTEKLIGDSASIWLTEEINIGSIELDIGYDELDAEHAPEERKEGFESFQPSYNGQPHNAVGKSNRCFSLNNYLNTNDYRDVLKNLHALEASGSQQGTESGILPPMTSFFDVKEDSNKKNKDVAAICGVIPDPDFLYDDWDA